MKIGLAGVPGSGKTDFAQALSAHFVKNKSSSIVIDDYVQDVEDQTDLALSFDAAYIGNMHVALERASRERKAYETHSHVITCGTLFETSSYAAQSLEADYKFLSTDEERRDFVLRSEATMQIMTCFYLDLLKYDYIFHLSPLQVSNDVNIEKLEQGLQSAFQAFNLFQHTVLPVEGSTKEEIIKNRLEKALKVIDANNTEKQDVQAEESNGSGV
jgi:hypothetical protein